MEEAESGPIQLTGWKRGVVLGVGALFVVIPVLAYIDTRIGLLAAPQPMPEAFGLLMAVFAVIGGVFLLSGFLGFWLIWKDVGTLDLNRPDPTRVTVSPTRKGVAGTGADDEPPFDGVWFRTDLTSADRDFSLIAKDYFENLPGTGGDFDRAVVSVWRSKGRPNYAYQIDTPAGQKWIKVPHRGRAGAGAGETLERHP